MKLDPKRITCEDLLNIWQTMPVLERRKFLYCMVEPIKTRFEQTGDLKIAIESLAYDEKECSKKLKELFGG